MKLSTFVIDGIPSFVMVDGIPVFISVVLDSQK